MDVPDEFSGAGPKLRSLLGTLGRRRVSRLIVEAVKVAAGLLELLDPFLGLVMSERCQLMSRIMATGAITSAIIMWQSNVPFPWG